MQFHPNLMPFLPNQMFTGMAPNFPQSSPPLPPSKSSQNMSADDVATPTSQPPIEVLDNTDEEVQTGGRGCKARMPWNEDDDIHLVSGLLLFLIDDVFTVHSEG